MSDANDFGQHEPGKAPSDALTPELLEWARRSFSEEEALAGLREIRETGGLTFEELILGLDVD